MGAGCGENEYPLFHAGPSEHGWLVMLCKDGDGSARDTGGRCQVYGVCLEASLRPCGLFVCCLGGGCLFRYEFLHQKGRCLRLRVPLWWWFGAACAALGVVGSFVATLRCG